jgi:hypothetical protein
LLDVASVVAWRPGLLATVFFVTREQVLSELRYALDELTRAGAIPRSHSRTTGLSVAAVAGGVFTTAVVVRKRRRAHGRGVDEDVPA